MYSNVKFEVKLKPEFVNNIHRLINDFDNETWETIGFPEYDSVSRSHFIPFGACDDHVNTLEGDIWKVSCSLKDYDDTIQSFLDLVGCHIFEEVISFTIKIESSEDWNESHREVTFVDGKFDIAIIGSCVCPSTWYDMGL